MQQTTGLQLQTIDSLDTVMAPGIEAVFAYAREKKLIHSIAIGVIREDQAYVRLIGPDVTLKTCFEIGSVTKIYTVELIESLVRQGLLRWEDPVVDYLPAAHRPEPAEHPFRATLLDIAAHCSGLPLLPTNLHIRDGLNPFASYGRTDLEQYLHHLHSDGADRYPRDYSNAGYAILGYVLEHVSGLSYGELLEREILKPVGMTHTYLAAPGATLPDLVQGHTQAGRLTQPWRQNALTPSGGICSTMTDQLRWMAYLLAGYQERRLFTSYTDGSGSKDGVGWSIDWKRMVYHRSGTTGGCCSYMSVCPTEQRGLVLFMNRQNVELMRAFSANCERALCGEKPLPLSGDYGVGKAKVLEFVRACKRKVGFIDSAYYHLKRIAKRARQ